MADLVSGRCRNDMGKSGGAGRLIADVCIGIRWLPFALTLRHGKKKEGESKKSGTKT